MPIRTFGPTTSRSSVARSASIGTAWKRCRLGLCASSRWRSILTRTSSFGAANVTSPICASTTAQERPPEEGQLRAGAHSDYGAFTILKGEDAPGGLQVLCRGGEWADVPLIEEGFIINIGDLLMRWTNDKWVSTIHRVVNPPEEV